MKGESISLAHCSFVKQCCVITFIQQLRWICHHICFFEAMWPQFDYYFSPRSVLLKKLIASFA